MKNNLINVRRTLHDLLKALPAIKANRSADALKKHMALIRFYQNRYDLIAANNTAPTL